MRVEAAKDFHGEDGLPQLPFMSSSTPGDLMPLAVLPKGHVNISAGILPTVDDQKFGTVSHTGDLPGLPTTTSFTLDHLPKEKFSDGVSHFTLSLRAAERRVYLRTDGAARREQEPSLVSLLNWSFSAPPPLPSFPVESHLLSAPDAVSRRAPSQRAPPRGRQRSESGWQEVGELRKLGVWSKVSALLQQVDGESGSGKSSPSWLSARTVCRSWYVGLPVQRMAVASRDPACERRLLGGSLCDKAGLCLCKLHRFRDLTHLDVELLLPRRPALCLAATAHLPRLSVLSLSLDSQPEGGEAFPFGLTSLRLYGASAAWLERVARLPHLAALAIFPSPRFSATSDRIDSIEPLKRLGGSLRALCIEINPAWDNASFDALASLTGLTELTLNGLSSRCLCSISRLPRLRSLELSFDCEELDSFVEFGSEPVLPPPSIEHVSLEICSASSQEVAALFDLLIPYCDSVHSIELTDCSLNSSAAKRLASYRNLQSLLLHGVDAPGSVLRYLQPLQKLETLELDGIRINEHTLHLLPTFDRLSALTGLTIDPYDCERTATMASLKQTLSSHPSLTYLQIHLTSECLIGGRHDSRTTKLAASLAAMLSAYPSMECDISASS